MAKIQEVFSRMQQQLDFATTQCGTLTEQLDMLSKAKTNIKWQEIKIKSEDEEEDEIKSENKIKVYESESVESNLSNVSGDIDDYKSYDQDEKSVMDEFYENLSNDHREVRELIPESSSFESISSGNYSSESISEEKAPRCSIDNIETNCKNLGKEETESKEDLQIISDESWENVETEDEKEVQESSKIHVEFEKEKEIVTIDNQILSSDPSDSENFSRNLQSATRNAESSNTLDYKFHFSRPKESEELYVMDEKKEDIKVETYVKQQLEKHASETVEILIPELPLEIFANNEIDGTSEILEINTNEYKLETERNLKPEHKEDNLEMNDLALKTSTSLKGSKTGSKQRKKIVDYKMCKPQNDDKIIMLKKNLNQNKSNLSINKKNLAPKVNELNNIGSNPKSLAGSNKIIQSKEKPNLETIRYEKKREVSNLNKIIKIVPTNITSKVVSANKSNNKQVGDFSNEHHHKTELKQLPSAGGSKKSSTKTNGKPVTKNNKNCSGNNITSKKHVNKSDAESINSKNLTYRNQRNIPHKKTSCRDFDGLGLPANKSSRSTQKNGILMAHSPLNNINSKSSNNVFYNKQIQTNNNLSREKLFKVRSNNIQKSQTDLKAQKSSHEITKSLFNSIQKTIRETLNNAKENSLENVRVKEENKMKSKENVASKKEEKNGINKIKSSTNNAFIKVPKKIGMESKETNSAGNIQRNKMQNKDNFSQNNEENKHLLKNEATQVNRKDSSKGAEQNNVLEIKEFEHNENSNIGSRKKNCSFKNKREESFITKLINTAKFDENSTKMKYNGVIQKIESGYNCNKIKMQECLKSSDAANKNPISIKDNNKFKIWEETSETGKTFIKQVHKPEEPNLIPNPNNIGKESNMSIAQSLGFNSIPFIVGQSTSRSYHIGLNIQQTLSLMRLSPSVPTLKIKSGEDTADCEKDSFPGVSTTTYKPKSCPACTVKSAVTVKDEEEELLVEEDPWYVPQKDSWDQQNIAYKKNIRCTCLPKNIISFNEVLGQLFQAEGLIPSCPGSNTTIKIFNTAEENARDYEESNKANVRPSNTSYLTRLLRNIQRIQDQYLVPITKLSFKGIK